MLQPPQPQHAAEPSPLAPPLDPVAALRAALRGHYDFERELGQGAFATVYLARDLKHERKVAIKVLHTDPTSDTGELRFIREIRLLARLQHPNILPLHDSGHVEALLYYVMPYVQGETLRDRIDRERQLDVAAACSIARDVADALAYAHGQGIVHRDIKPENILLSAGHPILADFGIARVIDLAGVRQLTRTSMGSPGTPAYMSPEQLTGDKELDGRSDTYSLGCVLFEMLTGKPPFSGKDGFVRRFTESPPEPTSIRKDLPPWLNDVIAVALARSQDDRYQTAHEFVTALSRPVSSDQNSPRPVHPASPRVEVAEPAASLARDVSPSSAPNAESAAIPFDRGPSAVEIGERQHWTTIRKYAVPFATLALALSLMIVATRTRGGVWRASFFGTNVDSSRIAMLPLGGSAPAGTRERTSARVYAALSKWKDLKLATDEDVAAAAGENLPPTTTRAAADLARQVGAGKFIWGQMTGEEPSEIRLQLFDADENVSRRSISFPASGDTGAFDAAIRELLKSPDRPAAADGGDGRTSSFSAWTAYAGGHAAFWNSDLAAAESAFRVSAVADPNFGPARVWLAQTLAIKSPTDRSDWRDQVLQGLRAPSGLSDRDRIIATAVSRISDRHYPEACAEYRRLTKADSADFLGLYGLGQCQALDSLVIPSAESNSGWRFRSRYSNAASAFMQALSANPNAHKIISFQQLQDLLPTASTKTRRGRSNDGQEFAAYPALIHDTVVFVPYPLAQFATLPAERTAAAKNAAIEADLGVLFDFATDWARRTPNSPAPFLALADVLEARGEISRSRSGSLSAMDAALKARELASTPRDRQLAAARYAWLLFKQGQYASARILADSLVSAPAQRRDEAQTLIGLAALTGKLGKTTELARLTRDYAASAPTLPVPVMDAAAPFFAFAALGVCADTTIILERRLDDELSHYVAENQIREFRRAVKARPLSMLGPCTGGRSSLTVEAGSSRLLHLQQAFANNDKPTLATLLDRVTKDARTQRPGDISLEYTYQVAWLRSAMGDTAGAERQLDRALGALSSLSAASLRDAASAAAAGRAMAFRAELANARGQGETRRRWASAVTELWATADAPLQKTVTRMRDLASRTDR